MSEYRFELFGWIHGAILISTALMAFAWVAMYRAFQYKAVDRTLSWTLAGLLLATKLGMLQLAWTSGQLDWQRGLPMHLCDWTLLLMSLVLLYRVKWIYEVLYFWGLSGTVQALITPDLNFPLADWRTLIFFFSHAGIIVGVVYLTLGLRMRPYFSSIGKAFLATQVYILFAALVNLLLGANYGYLCAKPLHPSLLDYLGPWPWYIGSVEILMLTFFVFCYFPFWIADRLPLCSQKRQSLDQEALPSMSETD